MPIFFTRKRTKFSTGRIGTTTIWRESRNFKKRRSGSIRILRSPSRSVRDSTSASRMFARAFKAAQETFTIRELRRRVDFYSKGDLRQMQTLLASKPAKIDPNGTITLARYNLKMDERKFDELIAILD